MFKALFGLIKLCIFLLFLAVVFHNYAARQGLAFYLKSQLGAPVEIESAQVDLLGSKAFFRNIVVHNPPDFPETPLFKVPYLSLDFDLSALADAKVRFQKIEVDIGEIQIVRLPNSRVNWLNLKIIQPQENEVAKPRVKIDHFFLTLRRGIYRDMVGREKVKNFILDLDREDYLNIHSLEDMVKVISWESFKRMGLEKLGAGVLDQIREDLDGGM